MVSSIIAIIYCILFFGDFIDGLNYSIEDPFWILIGMLSTFSLNIILWYVWPKYKITITEKSTVHTILKHKMLTKTIIVLLWMVSCSIFIHAFNNFGGLRGSSYLGALIASFLSVILLKNIKSS